MIFIFSGIYTGQVKYLKALVIRNIRVALGCWNAIRIIKAIILFELKFIDISLRILILKVLLLAAINSIILIISNGKRFSAI
jgi:hypothetical protein